MNKEKIETMEINSTIRENLIEIALKREYKIQNQLLFASLAVYPFHFNLFFNLQRCFIRKVFTKKNVTFVTLLFFERLP